MLCLAVYRPEGECLGEEEGDLRVRLQSREDRSRLQQMRFAMQKKGVDPGNSSGRRKQKSEVPIFQYHTQKGKVNFHSRQGLSGEVSWPKSPPQRPSHILSTHVTCLLAQKSC